jgi:hypothetical protein
MNKKSLAEADIRTKFITPAIEAAGLLVSSAFIPDDGGNYLHNQRRGKMTYDSKAVLPAFSFWFLNSADFRGELSRTCTCIKVRRTAPDRVLRVLCLYVPSPNNAGSLPKWINS